MLPNQTQMLIDHLDENVENRHTIDVDALIRHDREAAREWQSLCLAVDAIEEAGLNEQVGRVRNEWRTQHAAAVKSNGAKVRSLYRNVMRVAACILVLAGGAAAYKYVSTSSTNLYAKYYDSYDLNTSRGAGSQDALVQAYTNKNWTAVLAAFDAAKEKDNKTYFLAGMADLELKKYPEAIERFEQVIAVNVHSGTDYFQDEAEYYLALSWLATKKVNEAMPILEKIRADKNHLFHQKVAEMSFTDLRLAQYKENK